MENVQSFDQGLERRQGPLSCIPITLCAVLILALLRLTVVNFVSVLHTDILTNQNPIPEDFKSRLRSGNACYHSVQNIYLLGCYQKI